MVLKDIIERQNKILEIIISSYVTTAIPIGSRLVSKRIGLSSATIRNIMSDLEELGYITHPHTSAGRIPTDKGYRRYIESLMRLKQINKEEQRRIEDKYKSQRRGIEDLIKKTAEVLANITHHTGIVLFPKFKRSSFKRIDLVSIGKRRVLVILITSTGIVKNFIIDTKEEMGKDLDVIANLLNSDYNGLPLEDIKSRLVNQLKEERDSFRYVITETSEIIEAMLQLFYVDELYLGGTASLLSQPEFENAHYARSLLKVFENKDELSRLMEGDLFKEGIKVYIGKENKCKNMQNCSIVSASYTVKDELIGRLGIIGPTRMAYDHLIPLVDYISETVSKTLSNLIEL
jgi:heat-inducible transcriptional repressor